MEEPNEEARVVPELYFLIAKFLSGGPLKETAKTLIKELESVEVLPRRLDWQGALHSQSYEELASRYEDVSWDRLSGVCARALRLARGGGAGPALAARLSLLSEALVRPAPRYAAHKQDHALVRRLAARERGGGGAAAAGGPGGAALFAARMLGGLQLQRRTLGHLSAVYCLVFDRSGRYVVTGADDLLVKVWRARDGRLAATLRGAGAEITDVCASADGALLAAGSVERLVRVWCLATGAPRAVLHAHQGTITSVHWAPPARQDLRWLASTSTDGSVAFWACSPGGHFLSQPVQYVERMRPGACHMICAAWSAGGAFLAAGSADHHVRVYRVEGGGGGGGGSGGGPRRVLEQAVHGDAVDSLAWAHRGLRFVSGSKDGCAALWTLHATQWRHTLLRCAPLEGQPTTDGKRLKVTMVCWDCSDAWVLTAVSDRSVRVWCARSGRGVRALLGHRDEAYVLEPHPWLPAVVLSAGHDGQLFVWHAAEPEPLARFHNDIPGQGDGALFDAKWGDGGARVAASDSHGHLLLLGLGRGHRLLQALPTELFFHTDYRPLVRDALGGALDEQTQTPPHLMSPPFLVDVEGAPHAPRHQRLVPGREGLALEQLVPAADAARNRIDIMIEALAAERTPPAALGALGLGGEARGVWRGEGVRHTAGSWQSGQPAPASTRPIVEPLPPAAVARIEETSAELNALEQAWWRREMRRRPVMINTAGEGGARAQGPRRRAGRRPAAPGQPQPRAATVRFVRASPEPEPEPEDSLSDDTSDESVRLSDASARTPRARPRARPRPRARARPPRADRSPRHTTTDSDTSISYSESKSSGSSDSSQYSDWEAGAPAAALAPPARARRRPLPARRYSPSTVASKRAAPAPAAPPSPGGAASAPAAPPAGAPELAEAYRPGEWLCAVSPRKAPYHPQMGDHCMYFRLGHQRYFEAVAEKDLYKVNPRDKPWERTHVYECECVKVVGIKYAIKPPRVVCLRLACSTPPAAAPAAPAAAARTFTVRYHDMPDVIDFLVLRQQYEQAAARRWGPGDRFRCMIDDSWWTGVVLERTGPAGGPGAGAEAGASAAAEGEAEAWARAAAAHFLSLRVRWDNGEVERLSPWDLEPLDPDRLPAEPGGAVPVLAPELQSVLHRAEPHEWPPHGDRALACRTIAAHIGQVMTLSVAEAFVAPVDLQLYPSYALVVPYPIDLATIKARFENMFYRRAAAAQFDVRYLATNAEQFNEPHSPIVRQARLVTDLLLHIISWWRSVDVVGKYHELAAAYHSSDDEPPAPAHATESRRARRGGGGRAAGAGADWRAAGAGVLRELVASADSEPFRHPVSPLVAPDYPAVVPRPMDLSTAGARLAAGRYARAEQLAADVRLVFANSRLYNTNKRSRIYSMTVRLSALFESLWARAAAQCAPAGAAGGRRAGPRPRTRRAVAAPRPGTSSQELNGLSAPSPSPFRIPSPGCAPSGSGSSDSEPLAATSRRVHGAGAVGGGGGGGGGMGADSWDSDAPLDKHRKGKGVGKKSRHGAPVPPAGRGPADERVAATNGGSESPGSHGGPPGALLAAGAAHLAYDSDSPPSTRKRRRRRGSDSGSGGSSGSGGGSGGGGGSSDEWGRARRRRGRGRRRHAPKRVRERFTDGTSSCSSSSSGAGAGAAGAGAARGAAGDARRYESDHSYKPRYSTDDDAPLQMYRQRQETGDGSGAGGGGGEAGPSTSSRRAPPGHARGSAGVSLRALGAPRRYNEDSEEDSVAAISKRGPHHHRRLHRQEHTARRRHLHASQNLGLVQSPARPGAAGTPGAAGVLNSDHNYFNGHSHQHGANGTGLPEAESGGAGGPVSISSRGRVRKLTAKARGLLRD